MNQDIKDLVLNVFSAWGNAGLHFLVLRNEETLPTYTTHDIDLGMAPDHMDRAVEILVDCAAAQGFLSHNVIKLCPQYLVMLYDPKTMYQVHFDIVGDLTWRGTCLVPAEMFLKDPFEVRSMSVANKGNQAYFNILCRVVLGGHVKESHHQMLLEQFNENRAPFEEKLSKLMGVATGRWFSNCACHGRWSEIEKNVSKIRKAVLKTQYTTNFFATTRNLGREIYTRLKCAFNPPGVCVVIQGGGEDVRLTSEWLIEALGNTCSPSRSRVIAYDGKLHNMGIVIRLKTSFKIWTLLRWTKFKNGLAIVTMDENDTMSGLIETLIDKECLVFSMAPKDDLNQMKFLNRILEAMRLRSTK